MRKKLLVGVGMIAAGITSAASANVISINFNLNADGSNHTNQGYANTTQLTSADLPASATAGVVPATNWNNFDGAIGGASDSSLVDSTGSSVAGASVSLTIPGGSAGVPNGANSSGAYSQWVVPATPSNTTAYWNDVLMSTCTGSNANNWKTPWTISLANIPFTSYNIIVIQEDNAGIGDEDAVTVGSQTYFTDFNYNPGYNYLGSTGSFVKATQTSYNTNSPYNTAAAQSNYAEFDGLSGANQSITIGTSAGFDGDYLSVAGIQIVDTSGQVPEPACLGLLGAASVLMMRRRAR